MCAHSPSKVKSHYCLYIVLLFKFFKEFRTSILVITIIKILTNTNRHNNLTGAEHFRYPLCTRASDVMRQQNNVHAYTLKCRAHTYPKHAHTRSKVGLGLVFLYLLELLFSD